MKNKKKCGGGVQVGGGCQGGCERRIEVLVGGVRVDVNEELKFIQKNLGGGVGGGGGGGGGRVGGGLVGKSGWM